MPTIGRLLGDARAILNDVVPITGSVRYSDEDLIQAFNTALLEIRAKRPDAFLALGLRLPVPQYKMPDDAGVAFPLDQTFYPACLYYVVGRSELREDEFTQDSRAVALMNKFVSQLLQVSS